MAKRLLLTAFILTFGTFPAIAQSPEQLLKDKFLGKMLAIRYFYLDDLLRYDASGQIKGHPKKGAWTIAQFKINKVRLRSDGFELQGERIAIGWDTKKESIAFFNLDGLSIKVEDLPPASLTSSKIDQLAQQIFVVLRNEPDTVPDYWRALVTGNVVAETDAKGQQNFHLKDRPNPCASVTGNVAPVHSYAPDGAPIYCIGANVSRPKPLSQHEPEFSPLARQFHYEGTTILSMTVNESGSPEDIQVLRPAGFGLDDAAVEAVKAWRFDPAKLDGKPVKAFVQVEVTYHYGP